MFRILVVDDDKNTRKLLETVLKQNGFTAITAKNGIDALDIMDHEQIDLIVLDIMMPEMDGYEFTETLRGNGDETPILMVSAKHQPEDKRRGFISGTDDYIVKPVDQEEMILRVRALLRRARIVSERRIVFEDIVLDYDSQTVTRGEEQVELPQKEFLLLYKLLSYPGKIFTRNQLMDEIWGAETETGWETLTVHIGRLRRHFEHWNVFEIVAIRGLGYKVVKK
ncbi:MAG: response regulator transcription factor [Clostridia bacterium]|nr:response regulator transcription factor [Clostridia bacterium]